KRIGRLSQWRIGKRKATNDSGGFVRGRAIPFADRHIGIGESEAEIFVEVDGSLRLATSVRDVGVGAYTMHRQVAAEVLGGDPEIIRIGGTGNDGPYGGGVKAQRGPHVEGLAFFAAATSLTDVLRREAAGQWNVELDKVRWHRGRARIVGSKKNLALKTYPKTHF